jgi:hypothetical protein
MKTPNRSLLDMNGNPVISVPILWEARFEKETLFTSVNETEVDEWIKQNYPNQKQVKVSEGIYSSIVYKNARQLKKTRVILYTNKITGEVEIFSSLKPFFDKYPEFVNNIDNINTYLSRKKVAYETELIKIERIEVQS